MTALAWLLIAGALVVGGLIGRVSRRPTAPESPEPDPRFQFEQNRADRSEKKIAAQEGELRDWAASHKALEAQVADLQRQAVEAKRAVSAPSSGANIPEPDESPVSGSTDAFAALEATITRLEGQIAAGAGSVSQTDAIASTQQAERIAVLEAAVRLGKRKIGELERRLDL